MKIFIAVTLLSMFSLIATADTQQKISYFDSIKVPEMQASTLYKLIQKDEEEFFILDIREPDQIGHGEIFHVNLIAITRGYLELKIESAVVDKDAKIVVYCCTGKRGKLAAKTLSDMGYTNVFSLQGGIKNWVNSGFPLDTVYGEVVLR